MAVTANFYGGAITSLLNKEIDYDSDTIKVMLCASGYTPNLDVHRYKSEITNEVTGAGYTAGGATLTGKTLTYDAGSNTLSIDSVDPSWASITVTARYGVVYDSTPATDATRPLIGLIDFGADIVPGGGDLELQWDAAGIASVVVS